MLPGTTLPHVVIPIFVENGNMKDRRSYATVKEIEFHVSLM